MKLLVALCFSVLAVPVATRALVRESQPPKPNPQIDYPGFLQLTKQLQPIRARHRVPVETFLQMARETNTIILDTRSKAAYDQVHIRGAKHLNFSDFTASKLQKLIPDRKTRILIYCNNNFAAETAPPAFEMKSRPLALNIPTFVNLHGYGYENVYELAAVVDANDPRVPLAGTLVDTSTTK